MPSLDDNFKELLERIRQGRSLGPTGFEPIYYLVFWPHQILEVKRQMPAWISKMQQLNWTVHNFSVAKEIAEIFEAAPMRKIWLKADQQDPLNWDRTNKSLTNAVDKGALLQRLEAKLADVQGDKNAIMLVTDLEALHPYLRIGAIESKLYGQFRIPTIFFYPGQRTGKTNLKFLGFYKDDGNYRSVHVGG